MNKQTKSITLQKRSLSLFLSLVIALGLIISIPQPVMAGNGVKRLINGKTVTTTLTGSKKHNVRCTVKNTYKNEYEEKLNFSLYIDGKAVYTYKSPSYEVFQDFADVWLLEINNNTKLIWVWIGFADPHSTTELKIFSYSDGKLRMCGDIKKLVGVEKCGWEFGAYPEKAGNNKLVTTIHRQVSSIGNHEEIATFNYSASKNKVSRASNINEVSLPYTSGWDVTWYDNWGTVIKSFNTYTKAGGKTLSFIARIGEYLRVQRVTYLNGALYFEVKNVQGKVGWYKEQKKWDPYFNEAVFGN